MMVIYIYIYLFIYLLKIVAQGKNNIAFTALYELGETEQVIDLLIKTDRIPEAAVFARTYAPQQMSKITKLWKSNLESQNRKKVAESLADPADYPNLFPDIHIVKEEQIIDTGVEEEVQDEKEEEIVQEEIVSEPKVQETVDDLLQ